MTEWQTTFKQAGPGSSFSRATIIAEQIYDRAAPIPDVTPSPDRNSFLHKVAALVDSVCAEGGARSRGTSAAGRGWRDAQSDPHGEPRRAPNTIQ